MKRIAWAGWGDVNAFFGLMLDNVAVLLLLTTLVSTQCGYTARFVVERMIPGTALGVLLGDLVYTFLAIRLGRSQGRSDVTAMPLGLDTPSTFAVGFLVLQPALKRGLELHPGDNDAAMNFGWHVGAAVLIMIGLLKTLVSPFGNMVRRLVPRAGLLGSLAAIALALIALLPLIDFIGSVPLVGLVSLTVILVTLLAHRKLPGNFPGALAAVFVGIIAFYVFRHFDLVPKAEGITFDTAAPSGLPPTVWQFSWWANVLKTAAEMLPVMLPFAVATVVGGIDCTESAAAAGDEYDTRSILLTEGLASVAAGLCGGVIQNTPYIGHPAYKAMGGRSAYTLATALFIGAAGLFGWFAHFFEWLPQAAMFPILVYVGIEITAVSFRATPEKHYPALALAILPALAQVMLIIVNRSLAGTASADPGMFQTLTCLANGFIVTSLLWGAALAALLDGRSGLAAGYLLVAAVCSLLGVIHSPLPFGPVGWPWDVVTTMPATARYESPYHWAGAYALSAVLLLGLSLLPVSAEPEPVKDQS